MRRLAATLVMAVGLLAGPALAAPEAADLPACGKSDPAVVAADQAMFDKAMDAFQDEGWPALKSRLPEMEAAVARAPAVYHPIERCDGVVLIHVDSQQEFLAISRRFGTETTRWQRWPYPYTALLVGATYVEYRDYAHAIPVLMKAVAMAPDDARIVGEAAGALNLGGQPQQGLALVDRTLAAYDIKGRDRGRLLRARGFAYVEMGRLDEAEAAYRESLIHDPTNPTARGELDYIAGLRNGAPRTLGEPVNSTTGEANQH